MLSKGKWAAWLMQLRLDPMGTVGDISIHSPHEWCEHSLPESVKKKLGFIEVTLVLCTRPKHHTGPHCDGILDDYKMITWTSVKQYKGIK